MENNRYAFNRWQNSYFRPGPEVSRGGGVQKLHVENRKETEISLEINGTFFVHFGFADLTSSQCSKSFQWSLKRSRWRKSKMTRRGIHVFVGRPASHPRFPASGSGDDDKNRLFFRRRSTPSLSGKCEQGSVWPKNFFLCFVFVSSMASIHLPVESLCNCAP